MPAGKVFNAAENQVLFSPVSNYLQGKAVRAETARTEKQNELLDAEIESAPSKMAAAIAKAQLDEEKIRLAMEKSRNEISDAEYTRRKEVYGKVVEAAKKKFEKDGDIDLDWIN